MVHPASVTNAISRLEQRGLVERQTSPDDRRVVLATITPSGRTVARDATAALNRTNFGIEALSPDETAELTTMLRRVRMAVGDIQAEAGRGSPATLRTNLGCPAKLRPPRRSAPCQAPGAAARPNRIGRALKE